jgi:hypothetical protein
MAPIADHLRLSLHGMTAVNTQQPSTVDLNFSGLPQFAVGAEGGRPVFVTPASIGETNGTLSTVESRRYAQFASVNERRADLRSRASSVTATLDYRPAMTRLGSGTKVPVSLSYTYFDAREQFNGFSATTTGDPRRIDWQRSSVGRHSLVMSTAVQVPDWLRLTIGLRVRSGSRYTPIVLGDINADGMTANDRAFVFSAAQSEDSLLRAGLEKVMEEAPRSAQRCLRSQLGAIARPNSCVGPSSALMHAIITIDPARVGLQNRGTLQVHVNNVFAGADQLLHGSRHLHGWGQPVYPDPVLLRVNGFDPVARRFRYDVNRSFGDPRSLQRFIPSPFRVTLEFSIDVGPDREEAELRRRLAPPSTEGVSPLDSSFFAEQLGRAHDRRNLFEVVVRRADEYGLTGPQRDSLERLGRAYGEFRDSTYGALAGVIAAHGGSVTDEAVRGEWRRSLRAVARREWRTGEEARHVLTRKQVDEIFSRNGPLGARPIVMDERELARFLARWQERVF